MAESSSFTPIVVYHSETADTLPAAVNLNVGELALNITDRKLYTKDSDDNIVLIGSMSLVDLEDVDMTSVAEGDTIIWDSSTETWIVGTPDLGDLTDVDTSTAVDGDTLIFDSSTSTFVTGSTTLGDLSDVDLTSLSDGDIIIYDEASGTWIVSSIGDAFRVKVKVVPTASYTVTGDDENSVLLFTNPGAVNALIPSNSTEALPVGYIVHLHQQGGQVTANPDTGVTINTAETRKTRKLHSSISLIKVAANEWNLFGDSELA